VRLAFTAAWWRAAAPRWRAADRAGFERADFAAADRPSFPSARLVALDRFGDTGCVETLGPRLESRRALSLVPADTFLPRGDSKFRSGSTGLGEPYCGGLPGGCGTVLSLAWVVHFFADELSRLSTCRFPFSGIRSSPFYGLLFRHAGLLR